MEDYNQKAKGSMTYPKKGTLNRVLFKIPKILWRMGLGSILSSRDLGGSKMLVITTWGRKSKKPRHTMLSYMWVGGKEYVCSGWGAESDWYKNIQVDPQVSVQVGEKIYSAKARRVMDLDEYTGIAAEMFETGGDSHFDTWLESFGIEKTREDMIAKRDRLHFVGFDENKLQGPPPMRIDLLWVWGLIVVAILGVCLVVISG